ncbi:MAG: zinc dependent phospholipase C family protein [Candidatus Methanofastidiosia archaeon]
MKKTLVATTFLLIFFSLPCASAWGHQTHRYITKESMQLLDNDEKQFFEKYENEIIYYSTIPDKWRQQGDERGNLIYHLSYPNGYGKGPEAVAEWVNALVSDLREGKYYVAAMDAGVISHYVGDSLCALHTWKYVTVHPLVEKKLDETINEYKIKTYTPVLVENVEEYVRQASLKVNQYYDTTVKLAEEGRWDELKEINDIQLQLYAQTLADILHTAYITSSEQYDDKGATENNDKPHDKGYVSALFAITAFLSLIIAIYFWKKR